MKIEDFVAQHYTVDGLEARILAALAASGKDIDHLAPSDLAPVDEFHIGGRQATVDLAAELGFEPNLHLLDVGSGLGGASRYFADQCRCRVTGVDLTEDYIRLATILARRVGLEDRVCYRQASALALPFANGGFDGATMLHVGMNIEDKAALFGEVRRVLKPGARFGLYEVMRENGGAALLFPLPWASGPETSFVATAEIYRALLEQAGFTVRKIRDRRAFALAFFDRIGAKSPATGGPPPLGLQLLMGSSAPQKIANLVDQLRLGRLAPVEIIAEAV